MLESDEYGEEPLDPRIQLELEKLNKASLLINKLENDLDAARGRFRLLLTDSTHALNALSKTLGSCIEKAKLYYDYRLKTKELQVLAQKAATRFERATSMQAAAREMVELAEQGYQIRLQESNKKISFDTSWQEMLNHATFKVAEAEKERLVSELEHQRASHDYAEIEQLVNREHSEHKRAISKSKPYYEMKAKFHSTLETEKLSIDKLQQDIDTSKKLYSKALRSLEQINLEIHARRKEQQLTERLGERGSGVGSEMPPPGPHAEHPRVSCHYTQIPHQTKTEAAINSTLTIAETHVDKNVQETVNMADVSVAVSCCPATVPVVVEVCPVAEEGRSLVCENSIQSESTVDGSLDVSQLTRVMSRDINSLSPVVLRRHRRKDSSANSLKLSARKLMEDAYSDTGSDTGSTCSAVLDDEAIGRALSGLYFDSLPGSDDENKVAPKAEYDTLPESLSHLQRNFEISRKRVSMHYTDLKPEQVLQLLADSDDESAV